MSDSSPKQYRRSAISLPKPFPPWWLLLTLLVPPLTVALVVLFWWIAKSRRDLQERPWRMASDRLGGPFFRTSWPFGHHGFTWQEQGLQR